MYIGTSDYMPSCTVSDGTRFGYGFDSHSHNKLFLFHRSEFHTMHRNFWRKWGTECLNTSFPLPNLLYTRDTA